MSSSTFEGKFNFQGLFKTVLYIKYFSSLCKPCVSSWTLSIKFGLSLHLYFVYISTVKRVLASLCICMSSHEPSLLENVVSTKISYAGSYTVKTVLSGYSKIDKRKVSKTNGSLMKVESIAEENSAILLTCIKRKSV